MNNLAVVFIENGRLLPPDEAAQIPDLPVRRQIQPNFKNDFGSVMSAYAQSCCYNSALGKAYGMLLGF